MKNIALIAGLSLALSTMALADNSNLLTTPALVYSYDTAPHFAAITPIPIKQINGPDLTTWGWSYYYDFKSKDSAAVITKPIFTATNLVGVKGLNMEIEGFGGVGLNGGKLIGGVAGIFRGKIADQVWLGVGPGVTTAAGKPLGFGVLGQISVKF